jgi:hypothetical protein
MTPQKLPIYKKRDESFFHDIFVDENSFLDNNSSNNEDSLLMKIYYYSFFDLVIELWKKNKFYLT